MNSTAPTTTAQHNARTSVALMIACPLLALAAVAVVSPFAALTTIHDMLAAIIVLAPLALGGLWLVPLCGIRELPFRWHLLLGAALGIGGGSLLVLALGLAGWLPRWLWIVILTACAVGGIARLRTLREAYRAAQGEAGNAAKGEDRAAVAEAGRKTRSLKWLWCVAAPFPTLAFLAASNAPGFVWAEEGFGYDVLEYHLQLPKEYIQSGAIGYLPHNVYSAFPANVEMLYLLGMMVSPDDLEVGTTCNMIHLLLGALAVFAAWTVGRDWSAAAGHVAGVMTATCGWLYYLSGLAYVEHGMLFFGLAATGAVLRGVRAQAASDCGVTPASEPKSCARWFVIGGVLAGLACGCKYTAVAMIAAPLALIVALSAIGRLRRRLAHLVAFVIACGVTFSPWLIKNVATTGNPVFPLAQDVFRTYPDGWDAESAARWQRGHEPSAEQSSLGARVSALWTYVVGDHDQRLGPALLVVALVGFFARRRDRVDWALWLVITAQLAVWMFATHLYARFAVVLLIPLALLCGRSVVLGGRLKRSAPASDCAGSDESARAFDNINAGSAHRRSVARNPRTAMIVAIVCLGACWSFIFGVRRIRAEHAVGAPASLMVEGKLPGYEYFDVINKTLPPDARILLVGEARAFYFRRDVDYGVVFNSSPFVAAVRDARRRVRGDAQGGTNPDAHGDARADARGNKNIMNWLHESGYSHVLVNWTQIERLRRSRYGFANEINEALFDRLVGADLTVVQEFHHPPGTSRHVTLYALKTP